MELMTPVSLAFWAMDDGSKQGSGFLYNTHSFSETEVKLLINILQTKFNLSCTIQSHMGHYRIYIRSNSMVAFRNLVQSHFHSSMLYKLL